MFDWNCWCNLCGNCEVDTERASQEIDQFVTESFGVSEELISSPRMIFFSM